MRSMQNESTSRYEHIDAKSTLIGATVEKIQLPRNLLTKEKYKTISFMCFNYIKTYIRYFIEIII